MSQSEKQARIALRGTKAIRWYSCLLFRRFFFDWSRLIRLANAKHRGELVFVNLLEVAAVFGHLHEVGMLVVSENVLGAESLADQRRRIVFVAQRDLLIQLPQLGIAIVKISRIEPDYVGVVGVVIKQH